MTSHCRICLLLAHTQSWKRKIERRKLFLQLYVKMHSCVKRTLHRNCYSLTLPCITLVYFLIQADVTPLDKNYCRRRRQNAHQPNCLGPSCHDGGRWISRIQSYIALQNFIKIDFDYLISIPRQRQLLTILSTAPSVPSWDACCLAVCSLSASPQQRHNRAP